MLPPTRLLGLVALYILARTPTVEYSNTRYLIMLPLSPPSRPTRA